MADSRLVRLRRAAETFLKAGPTVLTDVVRGMRGKGGPLSAAGISTDADHRRAQLSRIGLSAWARVRIARFRSRGKSRDERRQIFEKVMIRTTADAVEVVGNMKGVIMKFAQMASFDPGIPEGIRNQLASLQAAAPPMTPELSAECVERELGSPPHKVFKRWDPEPIASASIGQVHRAVTKDGRDVAVKVQYPGVDDAIRADLQNAGMLGNIIKSMGEGDMDVDTLLAEVAARVTEELDYTREAVNQQEFADRYRGHPFVKVPDVIPELTTARVLVSELVHGKRFAELMESGQSERDRAGEIIHRFAFGSIFIDGVFTSDPHPGNYLFMKDGRVCFLDFGLVKRLSGDEERTVVRGPVEAVIRGDKPALVESLREAGALAPGSTPDLDALWTLFELRFGPLNSDEQRAYRRGRRGLSDEERDVFRAAIQKVGPDMRFPATHAFFLRYIGGIASLLMQLGSEANWHRIAREVLFDDPASTPIGESWAELARA